MNKAVYVLIGISLMLSAPASAQTVGQRVTADVGGGGAGTIIEIGHGVPYEGYVKVHFDARNAYDPKAGDWIELKSGHVKALDGTVLGAAGPDVSASALDQNPDRAPSPTANASPLPVGAPAGRGAHAAANKVNRPPGTCRPMSGWDSGALDGKIKGTIAARYIRDGGALDDNHTPSTITFDSLAVTGSRPYAMPVEGAYETGSPDGPGGTIGTKVYLVKTGYEVCIDYPGYPATGYKGRLLIGKHDAEYACFIDSSGSWRCNQSRDNLTTTSVDK